MTPGGRNASARGRRDREETGTRLPSIASTSKGQRSRDARSCSLLASTRWVFTLSTRARAAMEGRGRGPVTAAAGSVPPSRAPNGRRSSC